MVSECQIAFRDIHFPGKLIRFMHFYRHYDSNLQFSFILLMKFFVSPRILTIFWGVFTNHSPCHMTIGSLGHVVSECGILLEIFISPVN